jgi:DNA-directed RNA polymerase specialized sigma24 family protein
MDCLPSGKPPPELAVLVQDELERLLASLEDETLRQVALMRVFAASNDEIAAAIGVCVRSVQHKIRAIAERWQQLSGGEPTP